MYAVTLRVKTCLQKAFPAVWQSLEECGLIATFSTSLWNMYRHVWKVTLTLHLAAYFFPDHRTFIYSLLTRGKPIPLRVMLAAGLFCSLNGFMQGHYLLHCAQLDDMWYTNYHCKTGWCGIYTFLYNLNYIFLCLMHCMHNHLLTYDSIIHPTFF